MGTGVSKDDDRATTVVRARRGSFRVLLTGYAVVLAMAAAAVALVAAELSTPTAAAAGSAGAGPAASTPPTAVVTTAPATRAPLPRAASTRTAPVASVNGTRPASAGVRTRTTSPSGSASRRAAPAATRSATAPAAVSAVTESGEKVSTGLVTGREYRIRNVLTSMCVTAGSGGVRQWPCSGEDSAQRFTLAPVAAAGPSHYAIRRAGRCLVLPGDGLQSADTLVAEGTCQAGGGGNDTWRLVLSGPDHYGISNPVSDSYCMEVDGIPEDGSDRQPGQRLMLQTCKVNQSYEDRLWVFE